MKKTKAHTRYRLENNKIVPGVTTILGLLNKPALVPWANKMGLQGIDTNKYVDDKATVGTLAHYLAECDISDKTLDGDYLDEFSKKDFDRAENSMLKYLEWKKQHDIKDVSSELKLVSERYKFGGTCDIYCDLDGVPSLIDIKTSKAIWKDMYYQVAGYKLLLNESGYFPQKFYILNIPRSEDEIFEFREIHKIDVCEKIFLKCLELYKLLKEVK